MKRAAVPVTLGTLEWASREGSRKPKKGLVKAGARLSADGLKEAWPP